MSKWSIPNCEYHLTCVLQIKCVYNVLINLVSRKKLKYLVAYTRYQKLLRCKETITVSGQRNRNHVNRNHVWIESNRNSILNYHQLALASHHKAISWGSTRWHRKSQNLTLMREVVPVSQAKQKNKFLTFHHLFYWRYLSIQCFNKEGFE